MTTTEFSDEFRERFVNATPNDVDNFAHRIEAKFGFLPAEILLTLQAYDDSKLKAPDALAYLALYEVAYSDVKDSQS